MDNFFVELCTAFWQLVAAVLRAFAPLLIGLTLAYLFNAPAEWIRRKLFAGQETLSAARPRGRIVSIVIAYALAALVLFLVVYAFLILILGALPADGFYATVQAVYAYFENAARDVSAFIEKYLPAKLGAGELDPAEMLSSWIEKHFSLEKVAGRRFGRSRRGRSTFSSALSPASTCCGTRSSFCCCGRNFSP